jgi:hypothetical protein
MINRSILLVGGDLDGQTYTASEGDTSVRVHNSEIKGVITDTRAREQGERRPQGHWCIYEQESEGSDRFVFRRYE